MVKKQQHFKTMRLIIFVRSAAFEVDPGSAESHNDSPLLLSGKTFHRERNPVVERDYTRRLSTGHFEIFIHMICFSDDDSHRDAICAISVASLSTDVFLLAHPSPSGPPLYAPHDPRPCRFSAAVFFGHALLVPYRRHRIMPSGPKDARSIRFRAGVFCPAFFPWKTHR
jgi:hypothetical protein